ncbi:hypothetical protein Scep_006036 [Stephania cephalantha]|uniref:Non-specific lipid-transfer protein n=1 Tax=Stephania cephalantha TaxID=152367 RepID=A0AAP0PLU4_9MAGN
MNRIGAITAPLLLMALIMLVSESAAIVIDCYTVGAELYPCLPYIVKHSEEPKPSPACCGDLKALIGKAKTRHDRVRVCKCIKKTMRKIRHLDRRRAAGLPTACGVPINPPPARHMDCSRVDMNK